MVAAAGLGVLALLPARLSFRPHVLFDPSDYCLAVDALAVGQHDYLFGDMHRVLLGRFLDGQLKTAWQNNYFDRPVVADVPVDVDGDGCEEVCLEAGDSTAAYAIAVDAGGREVLRLGPIHGERAANGSPWDGRIAIVGAFTAGGRRKVVCQLNAGFAQRPRGVALYDFETRRQDWAFLIGAPPYTTRCVELDDDGEFEVLITTGAPDNGASLGGFDDGHVYAIALDLDGTPLWQVPLGGSFAVANAAVLHRRGATPPRVVATFWSARGAPPRPGAPGGPRPPPRRVLARREYPAGLGVPRPLAEGESFVVGSADGMLRVFDDQLEVRVERRFPGPVDAWGSADLDGDGHAEIVASVPGTVLVLDNHLAVRARMAVREHPDRAPTVHISQAGLGRTRLAVHDGRAVVADVFWRPPLHDPVDLAAVAGVTLVAAGVVPLVARLRRRARRPSGAAAREFLLDYHQIRHETFERERPFARLRLWAQARAAGHPVPAGMLENACEEFERIGMPTLMRFAGRAAQMKVERARVVPLRRQARAIARTLRAARAASGEGQDVAVGRALEIIDAVAQSCYDAYWEVLMRAPCRPDHVAAEAMIGKRGSLERAHVISRFQSDPTAREPVLFDRSELRALIGELIENAARALEGAPDAVIEVTVAGHPSDPRRIVVTVRDNGPGIPPARRAEMFSPDGFPRSGGGFGLHHARETAHRWLAELTLEEPSRGRGVEVRLVLRACRIVDRPEAEDIVEART